MGELHRGELSGDELAEEKEELPVAVLQRRGAELRSGWRDFSLRKLERIFLNIWFKKDNSGVTLGHWDSPEALYLFMELPSGNQNVAGKSSKSMAPLELWSAEAGRLRPRAREGLVTWCAALGAEVPQS